MIRNVLELLVFFVVINTAFAANNPWIVHQDGFGPIRIGMDLIHLNQVLHENFSMPEAKEDQGCFYVNPGRHPGVSLMIEDGHLVRIDVKQAGTLTSEGAQVGDLEIRVRKLYGAKVKITQSQYGGPNDHYLTLKSSDGKYGIRFETEHGKVIEYYAGTYEAIQYVEGCE